MPAADSPAPPPAVLADAAPLAAPRASRASRADRVPAAAGDARPRRGAGLAGALALPAVLALVAGVTGGLLRAGALPAGWPSAPAEGALAGRALAGHATLMIGGFLGTVIGLERAVALRHRAAFAAPLASALGALAWLAGAPVASAWLLAAAAAAFVAVNAALLRREPALHTGVLLAAAACWLAGTARTLLAALAGSAPSASTPGAIEGPVMAGLAFLVLTVAAERLEMTRLARRPAWARGLFAGLVGALLAAVGLGLAAPTPVAAAMAQGVLGAALAALGAWLLAFDVARRIVVVRGLPRYMAACLLAGHAWLVVAGLAWLARAAGMPARDAALHAIGLGFVMSMVMAHAPVVLPALTGLRVQFTRVFWAPALVLHATLLLRLAGGASDAGWRAAGAAGNAAAIALFILCMAASVARRVPAPRRGPCGPACH